MTAARAVIVLVVFFFHICDPASLHPVSHTLPIVHLQANTEYKGKQEGLNTAKSGGNIIPHHGSELERAFGSNHGVNAGQVAGAGSDGDGNGGGSQSNNPQGGAAVIPVYAAGAANAHRNKHHSAGSRIHRSIGSSSLTAVLLAYLLLINPLRVLNEIL